MPMSMARSPPIVIVSHARSGASSPSATAESSVGHAPGQLRPNSSTRSLAASWRARSSSRGRYLGFLVAGAQETRAGQEIGEQLLGLPKEPRPHAAAGGNR